MSGMSGMSGKADKTDKADNDSDMRILGEEDLLHKQNSDSDKTDTVLGSVTNRGVFFGN